MVNRYPAADTKVQRNSVLGLYRMHGGHNSSLAGMLMDNAPALLSTLVCMHTWTALVPRVSAVLRLKHENIR